MPSTYSNLKIQLMATGENNTTWGNVTNLNLGTAIEEAIVGSADVTFASNNQTLTLTDTNASQTARNMRLRCTGTTGGSTRNLVVPSIEKPYIVQNDCADSVVVKTSAGTGITVPAGKTTWVYSDGTNVVDAVTHLSSLTLGTALPVGQGGTGTNTITSGYLVKGNGTSAFSASTVYDSGTNVGIGTSSPANLFEVWGAVTTTFSPNVYNVTLTGTSSATSGSSGTGISFRGFTTGSTTVSDLAFVSGIKENNTDGNYAGALVFGTRTNGSGGGSFERMRIDSSGNVGIGTAAPGAKLDVVGSLRTSTTITTGSSISTGYGVSTGDCSFELGGERSGSGASYIDLHATNSTDFEARLLRNSGANGTLDFINTGTGLINISQTTANPIAFNTNGAERFRVGPVGQIGLGGANYGTSGQVIISQGAGSDAVWGSVSSVASGATIDGVTIGYRSIPRSTTTTTAVVGDVGKCIAVSAGITIPNATFAAGDALSIYNDSGSAITITAGVTTLRQAGTANTGNRTLAARGMATIWFNSSTEAIISGAGIS